MPAGALRKRNVLDVLNQINSGDGTGGKNILVRVDFNVPMDSSSGVITDDSRIRGAIPTIQAILDAGCNAILCSHMGRPKLVQKGEDDEETQKERASLTLQPIAAHLSTLLNNREVLFAPDCMAADETIAQLPSAGGGICMLENLRFYKKEEKNDEEFAQKLASYANGYVNDAFGTCHRAHASTAGVPNLMDAKLCGIGALVASELAYLDFKNVGPNDKISAIIGGSKVSTKLPVIQGLLSNTDVLVLCGGLAFTFLRAMGLSIGDSLVEESMVDTARDLMAQAQAAGKQLVVPVDSVCAQSFPKGPMDKADTKTVDMTPGSEGIPDGWMGLDAGPKSIARFMEALKGSTKLIMNGPVGVFEVTPFDEGTRALVDGMEALTKEGTITVVGGGDSVAALEAFGKTGAVSYVSTGGGATLELLAGDLLPGVEAIANYEE